MVDPRYILFCQRLADAYMSDDLELTASFYSHPLAVYSGNSVRLELNRQDTITAVALRQARARADGVTRIVPNISSVTQSVDGRVVLHLTWSFVNDRDERISQSILRYYCREPQPGDLKIEMVEFEVMAYSDVPGTGPKRKDH